jgi:hypothetical protein
MTNLSPVVESQRSRPEAAQKNTRFFRLYFERVKVLECCGGRHHVASGDGQHSGPNPLSIGDVCAGSLWSAPSIASDWP